MNLIEADLQHIWHPSSQMKDYESFPPLVLRSAQGVYLELEDGTKVLDAIASWWCKSLGHGHPRLKAALSRQMERFEHVILANTTHETIVKLSQKLASLTRTLDKVFYASDGASAIEIALKMSIHSQRLQDRPERTHFMALENAYHGETIMTLALSDIASFREGYTALLPKHTSFIRGIPYVTSTKDPAWHDCSAYWPYIEQQLTARASVLSAIIIEPVVQGAGGMRLYSKDFIKRLRQ